MLQVFNDTEIAKGDLKVLGLIEKYERRHLVSLAQPGAAVCCALGLGPWPPALAHSLPSPGQDHRGQR